MTTKALLRALLTEMTPPVQAYLAPAGEGEALTFQLSEGLFIAHPKT